MSDEFPLSPIQEQVLTLIAAGSTAMDAAKQCGVHRNTVGNWLRKEDFQESLHEARARKELFFRDQAETLIAKVVAALLKLMDDPTASPNVRFKACSILLEKAIMFLPDTSAIALPGSPEAATAEPADPPAPIAPPEPEIVHSMHNRAQSPAPDPRPVAKSTQSSLQNADVDLCPCGSGLPFDRCCIGRTPLKLA
jgi:hypothetical protein